MLLFWKIRYIQRSNREFNNRHLYLDTALLDPALRSAVELLVETRLNNVEMRRWLKFKYLFTEERPSDLDSKHPSFEDGMRSIGMHDYFEDEEGNEITLAEIGPILTGNLKTVLLPSGMNQHDIDFFFAEKPPVPVFESELNISNDDLRLLGYFVRDFRELKQTALMTDGPGSITTGGSLPVLPNNDWHFESAVSGEEIRSFLSIFRRLYMTNEPANLIKSIELFEKCLQGHPIAKRLRGVSEKYKFDLDSVPEFCEMEEGSTVSFTTKRLIDVYLYTQYAHQPDTRRQRQFSDCLDQLKGRQNLMFWMFLQAVWECGISVGNAGQAISTWYEQYCRYNELSPDVIDSVENQHRGIGTAEKKEARTKRLFQERIQQLAEKLWIDAGKPEGGPSQFDQVAITKLKDLLD